MKLTDDEKQSLGIPQDWRDPSYTHHPDDAEIQLPKYNKRRDRIIGIAFCILFGAFAGLMLASWWIG